MLTIEQYNVTYSCQVFWQFNPPTSKWQSIDVVHFAQEHSVLGY